MRNVIFAINITLDGCVDHTKQSVDEEKLEYFTHLTRGVDLQIFGRKTYQLMVPYWPDVLKGQSETKADTEFCAGICLHKQSCLFAIVRQYRRQQYARCSWEPSGRST